MYLISAQLLCLILSFQKCDFWLSGFKYSVSSFHLIGLIKKDVYTITGHVSFLLEIFGVSKEQIEQLLCVDIVYTWAAQQSRGRINVNS